MPFGQPDAGGDKLDYNAVGPALLLFAVHSLEENIVTTFGISDALKVDVAVLTGPKGGEILNNALIFPKVLVSSLKKYAGQAYPDNLALGTLGQGAAKQGQSPAWTLNPYTEQDDATAQRFIAATPTFGKTVVGQPSAATQNSGWGAPNPAPAASGGWGSAVADPYPGHGIEPAKRAEFISHGITLEHLNAVKHIDGYENVGAAQLKAKAEELMRPQQQSAWDAPPF